MPVPPLRPAPHAARRARARATVGVLAALAVLTAAACGGSDPFAPRASLDTATDAYVVYPLSTAPAIQPAGLDVYGRRVVRPELRGATVNFDVAFDRAASGGITLFMPRALVVAPGGTPRNGLQVVTGTFDQIASAPRGNYVFDSTATVTPGQVVVMEMQGTVCSTSQPFTAKLVVDSVTAGNAIHLRVTVNPNCGFRSFASGLPTF